MKLQINASKLKLAATCMASNDIRYYLNGVKIEPRAEGGVFIVGTDGHRLMAVIDESGHIEAPAILRLTSSTLSKLPKVGSKNEKWTAETVAIDGTEYLAIKSGGDTPAVVHLQEHDKEGIWVEGKYPDWRQVMKFSDWTEKPSKPGSIQLPYLASVIPAFTTHKGFLPISFYACHESDGVLCRIVGHEYAAMVIMPIRDDGSFTDWALNYKKVCPPELPQRDEAFDKALLMAFHALDHLAAHGLIQRAD